MAKCKALTGLAVKGLNSTAWKASDNRDKENIQRKCNAFVLFSFKWYMLGMNKCLWSDMMPSTVCNSQMSDCIQNFSLCLCPEAHHTSTLIMSWQTECLSACITEVRVNYYFIIESN